MCHRVLQETGNASDYYCRTEGLVKHHTCSTTVTDSKEKLLTQYTIKHQDSQQPPHHADTHPHLRMFLAMSSTFLFVSTKIIVLASCSQLISWSNVVSLKQKSFQPLQVQFTNISMILINHFPSYRPEIKQLPYILHHGLSVGSKHVN